MNSHKTALVIIPPEQVWEPIQNIRRQYDEKIRRWMPHITLFYPFYPHEQFSERKEKLRAAAKNIQPFTIRLQKFNHFAQRKERNVLWLSPEPKPANALQALYQELGSQIKAAKANFTPHLTVGQIEGKEALEAIKNKLQQEWPPQEFTVNSVYMIWRNDPPDDIFHIAETIHLG